MGLQPVPSGLIAMHPLTPACRHAIFAEIYDTVNIYGGMFGVYGFADETVDIANISYLIDRANA